MDKQPRAHIVKSNGLSFWIWSWSKTFLSIMKQKLHCRASQTFPEKVKICMSSRAPRFWGQLGYGNSNKRYVVAHGDTCITFRLGCQLATLKGEKDECRSSSVYHVLPFIVFFLFCTLLKGMFQFRANEKWTLQTIYAEEHLLVFIYKVRWESQTL